MRLGPLGRRRRRRGPPGGTPTVVVVDEQDACPVDVATWQLLAARVLDAEGVRGDAELSLLFVDRVAMAELNGTFKGGDGPTDVLAFPIDAGVPVVVASEDAEAVVAADVGPRLVRHPGGLAPLAGRQPDGGTPGPDREPPLSSDLPLLLGDVVICPEVAAANAPTHAGTTDDELALLVVHGVLHILGMDHATPAEQAAMWAAERRHLTEFWRQPARDPWGES